MQANSGKVFNNFTWIAMVAVMAVFLSMNISCYSW